MRKNIRLLLMDRFFSSFWLLAPILVPFCEANGLSATQIFLVQGAYSLGLFVFEIPTGYFSDVVGRKSAMMMGAVLVPISVAVYAASSGFWWFVAAELLLAAGASLRSGADTAFLYDTLLFLDREKDHKKLEGTGHFLSSAGMGLAGLLGGFLAEVSLRLPFYVNVVTATVLLPVSILMKEPARKAVEPKSWRVHAMALLEALRYGWSHLEIRYAAFYSAMITCTGLAAWLSYFMYMGKLGVSVGYYGVLSVGTGVVSGLGGKVAHQVEDRLGASVSLALPLIIAMNMFLLSCVHSLWGVGLILLSAFFWGLSVPLLRDYVHKRTPSAVRATMLSAMSSLGRLGYVFLSAVVGVVIDLYSLDIAYRLLAGVFAVGGGLCYLQLVRKTKG